MGHEAILSGRILCGDGRGGASLHHVVALQVRNRAVIDRLTREDQWPWLTRGIFCVPHQWPVGLYRTQVITFGESLKDDPTDRNCWHRWLAKFESLLRQLYWWSAAVWLHTDFVGRTTPMPSVPEWDLTSLERTAILMRPVTAIIVLLMVSGVACADEASTVATLKKLGFDIQRDQTVAGEPVVGVKRWNGDLTDADLKLLKELPQIKELDLFSTSITDVGMKELKNLKHLTNLELRYTKVTDAGLKELRELKQLRTLNLWGTQVTDAGIKELKELKQLTTLDLSCTKITDAGVTDLKRLTQLEDLCLHTTQVTDARLNELKDLTRLKILDLRFTKVTGEGMRDLKQLKQLTALYLPYTEVTDAGVHGLKEIKQLKILDLTKTKVTDAGLKDLKELKHLTHLDLFGTQVTDAGVSELKGLKELKTLDLTNTQVTNAGLTELREAIPNCIIKPRREVDKDVPVAIENGLWGVATFSIFSLVFILDLVLFRLSSAHP